MPKRSEKRDTAKAEYIARKARGEEVSLRELAKEQGACPWFNETTYAKGILPIDTYKKDLDTIANEPLHYDWEALRESIKTHGLRNSTLSALMPSETSSQISNATNGIEPPRGYVSIKASKDGILRQVVPDYEHLHDAYELQIGRAHV